MTQTTKELIGTQHLLVGIVQVTQRQPEYAIGKVLKSYRPILLSDKLMPYSHRNPRILFEKSKEGIDGTIMMSEEHLNMFAEFNTAFIDRGRIHGIKEGQIYSVYYRDENKLGTAKSPQTITIPVDCGELLVLHVEDNNSTVLITDSQKEMFAGALMRTPLPVPLTSTASPAVESAPQGALFFLSKPVEAASCRGVAAGPTRPEAIPARRRQQVVGAARRHPPIVHSPSP